MTTAAFRATYAEWKVIKTRATVQLVFEIPIEQADEAYQVLGGMPIAAREVWCGIARLNTKGGDVDQLVRTQESQSGDQGLHETQPPTVTVLRPGADKRRRPWSECSYQEQAGMRCDQILFRVFLHDSLGYPANGHSVPREHAPRIVRELCGVNSRKQILPGTEAETLWLELDRKFNAWVQAERVTA